jgi:hypothetical protein
LPCSLLCPHPMQRVAFAFLLPSWLNANARKEAFRRRPFLQDDHPSVRANDLLFRLGRSRSSCRHLVILLTVAQARRSASSCGRPALITLLDVPSLALLLIAAVGLVFAWHGRLLVSPANIRPLSGFKPRRAVTMSFPFLVPSSPASPLSLGH